MEIVRDVLEILRVRGALNKTELIYDANLNYGRASCIINFLADRARIDNSGIRYICDNREGRSFYRRMFTTPPRYSLLE